MRSDVTVTIFGRLKKRVRCNRYIFFLEDKTGNENNVTITIFNLASNGCFFLSVNDAALA
jgi:uncharacterized protein YdeI (BOF family)